MKIEYFNESSQNDQVLDVTDRNIRVDRLIITFRDRFGNLLTNNGVDWSASFEISSLT